MNPNSLKAGIAYFESSIATFLPYDRFQFELQEYFVMDREDHAWVSPF